MILPSYSYYKNQPHKPSPKSPDEQVARRLRRERFEIGTQHLVAIFGNFHEISPPKSNSLHLSVGLPTQKETHLTNHQFSDACCLFQVGSLSFIPLFTGFYTSQVVIIRISDPSTVSRVFVSFERQVKHLPLPHTLRA